MATPTSPLNPLDAAIAKLRSEGRTDKEIAEILRNPSASSPQPSQPTGAGVQGPMTPMTGVLGNVTAVLSHARGAIPALTADLANLRNSRVSAKSRRISALKLTGAALIIVALGYAIYQEWQIHIVNAPPTSTAQREKAEGEGAAASAKFKGVPAHNVDDLVPSLSTNPAPSPPAPTPKHRAWITDKDVMQNGK